MSTAYLRKPVFHLLTIMMASLLLISCAQKPSTPKPKVISAQPIERVQKYQNPEVLLSMAQRSSPQRKASLYLQAAKLYWENNLTGNTKATIKDIEPEFLTHINQGTYYELKLSIALLEQDQNTLKELSGQADRILQLNINTDQKLRLLQQLTEAMQLTDQLLNAMVAVVENRGLLANEELDQIDADVWQSLKQVDLTRLNQFQYTGTNEDVKGWLELATTFRRNQISLEQQHLAISNWLKAWPSHPASLSPPREIELLTSLPNDTPQHLTLALPLSGRLENVGKAIRDGFFATYFQNLPSGDLKKVLDINDIQLFDTNQNDIIDLYQQNTESNSLIVGPLDKESINRLTLLDSLPVKTLALNYIEAELSPDNLLQFGLQPEAGTMQLAELIVKKDLKKVAIIAPEEEWGLKIHDSFVKHLNDLDGTVIESAFYSDQKSLASSVARLLATDDSKARAANIRKITGLKLEHEIRRRGDIDAIFMIAKPQTAKQLKPLFAFHFASDIPTFASSQVHNPRSDNTDLEGLTFVEMPWMLSNTNDIKHEIKTLMPDKLSRYERFFALGSDAFNLVPRLTLLNEIPGTQIKGQTGTLSFDEHGRIERHLEWARFARGMAIAIQE